MTTMRRTWTMAAGLLLAALAGACASTVRAGYGAVTTDAPFDFEGNSYVLRFVGEDYVVLRETDEEGRPGEISGWVREVFRVNRHDLADGRWPLHESMPGVYVTWRGGETFDVARLHRAPDGEVVATSR
jgi:hypothetical protein